ncbi:pyridoxamine 5'-phosphate oxidase family protein [Daeguia caeni]|uniref:Pyridoxamine 5'-phosphate oxidase family protein n=1 Tax=Daeguia caeni TaxID=439612 RepID=A0ABV9H500_9HYPH
MMIRELSDYDVRDMIQHASVGRMAYILDDRPVIVPMGFRFSGGSLYSFTTDGQKTAALARNNAVCVLFDDIQSRTKWRSVVVHGRYHRIEGEQEKAALVKLFSDLPTWWEPAYVRMVKQDGEERKLSPVFFRVDIESATGREAG